MFKKTISAILCAALLAVNSVSVFAAKEDKGEMLTTAGILPYSLIENSDRNVTRGELCYIAVKLAGIEPSAVINDKTVYFADVTQKHKYANEINALAHFGYVKAFSDGNFMPDYDATIYDASYILVSVLGYYAEAEKLGGYPTGYIQKAFELGLFKKSADTITCSEMNDVIFNTLTADRVKVTTDGKGNILSQTDAAPFIETVFGYERVEGVVMANRVTSLDNIGSAGEGYVRIGKSIYSVGDTKANELIGRKIVAYADEENTLVSAQAESKCKQVVISAENLNSNSTPLSVRDDKTNKSYTISPTAEFIYNGVREENLTIDDLLVKEGYLTLINNDNDSVYEYVEITSYENVVVDRINNDNITLSDAASALYELDKKDYKIFNDSDEIELGDIKQYDVLTMVKSKNNEYFRFYLSRNVITGAVMVMGEDTVNIEGTEYEISKDIKKYENCGISKAVVIGENANFYLNIENKVVAAMASSGTSSAEGYGYIFKLSGDYEDETAAIELLTANNKIERFSLAKKLVVDKKLYNQDMNFKNNIVTDESGNIKQIIKYKLNANNEIVNIDTAKICSENGETRENSFCEGELSDINTKTTKITGREGCEGRFYINSKTVTFRVPRPDSDTANDKSVYAAVIGVGGPNSEYMAGYDLDFSYVAPAVLCYGASVNGVGITAPYVLVNKIQQVFDEKSCEIRTQVIGADGTVLTAANDTVFADIKKGDIFQYVLDENKNVVNITLRFNSANPLKTTAVGNAYNIDYRLHAERRWVNLVALSRHGNVLMAAMLDDSNNVLDYTRLLYQMPEKIWVWDRETNEITRGTISDIDSVLYDSNPTGRVYMMTVYQGVWFAMVHK